MASVEELIIKLSADNSDLKRKLTDSEKGVQNFGGAVNKLGSMIAGAFSVAVVTNFAKAAFRAYEEQEQANRRLNFALRGNQTAFKELTAQAAKLQSTTGVDEIAIQQIQMLAAGAGNSTEAIKQLVTASLALATATGTDLQSAYMQISGTLNGIAGRMIPKMGVEFANLTTEQLKNGDVVTKLNDKYGTLATESALATSKLKANWGELMEKIGQGVSYVVSPAIEYLNDLFSSRQEKKDNNMNWLGIRRRGMAGGQTWDEYKKQLAEQQKITKEVPVAFKPAQDAVDNLTSATEKSTEAVDAWVEAYQKALELAQYDVPQIGQFAGITMGSATSKGITQKVAPRKGWNTKREAESPLAGAIRLENKLMDEQMAKIEALSNSFGMLASIMGENTMAYKAFAIAQATMDTYKAATMALATYPPPFGQIMMASTIALGLGNIAKISGAFAMGGIVGGGSYAGDKVLARVNSGEMILNTSQQAQLFAMANGGGGRSMEVYGRIKAGDIYLSNKRGAYLSKRRGS